MQLVRAVALSCCLSTVACPAASEAPDDAGTTTTADATTGEGSTGGGTGSTAADADDESSSTGSGPVAPGCGAPSPDPGAKLRSLDYDGNERLYRLFVPSGYDPDTPTALVLDFHGYTSSPSAHESLSMMNDYAEAAGVFVVYPGGLDNSWNAGGCCGPSLANDVDDVGFVRALVEKLSTELCIDPARVFATGASNGGFMSYRLACEASDLVAAIVPVIAVLGVPPESCDERPVPIMAFNGTADELIPYDGGTPPDGTPSPSVDETIAFWVEHNGCDTEPTVTFQSGDTTCSTYGGCDEGADVVLCVIDGGGHCFPGVQTCPFGTSTTEIHASQAALEFFAAHPMP